MEVHLHGTTMQSSFDSAGLAIVYVENGMTGKAMRMEKFTHSSEYILYPAVLPMFRAGLAHVVDNYKPLKFEEVRKHRFGVRLDLSVEEDVEQGISLIDHVMKLAGNEVSEEVFRDVRAQLLKLNNMQPAMPKSAIRTDSELLGSWS